MFVWTKEQQRTLYNLIIREGTCKEMPRIRVKFLVGLLEVDPISGEVIDGFVPNFSLPTSLIDLIPNWLPNVFIWRGEPTGKYW